MSRVTLPTLHYHSPVHQQPTLRGEHAELVPLNLDEHARALFDITPPGAFEFFRTRPDEWTPDAFRRWLAAAEASPRRQNFVVIDRAAARVAGCTSYLQIDEPARSLEIGATWYAPFARGTRINPECKLLLLKHAIEDRACVRVVLKTDSRNLHSRRAIAGIGAVREGTLRAERFTPEGAVKDTVCFSVTAEDWPRVRALLEARLRPASVSPLVIRPARAEDIPAVLPLVRAICELHHAMDPERFTFKPDLLDMYAKWFPERIADPRSVFLVAEDTTTNAIAGYVVGTVEPEVPIYWTPESGWIHDIVVLPEWRGRGIAQQLTRAAVEHFRAVGVARIRLETAAPNDAARAFFASMGFRPGTTEMLMML